MKKKEVRSTNVFTDAHLAVVLHVFFETDDGEGVHTFFHFSIYMHVGVCVCGGPENGFGVGGVSGSHLCLPPSSLPPK